MTDLKIKCLSCQHILKDRVYLLLPSAFQYLIKANQLSWTSVLIPLNYHETKEALGYLCPSCFTEFPKEMNKKIKNYLKQRRMFHQLMK